MNRYSIIILLDSINGWPYYVPGALTESAMERSMKQDPRAFIYNRLAEVKVFLTNTFANVTILKNKNHKILVW